MQSPTQNFAMSILVAGNPITEYQHEGRIFVEGRDGSDYKIRVRNNTFRKACFIVSVDGLSVLDGKECGDTSPGYVLEPHGLLDIACYKVNEATGAKFVFGGKDKSYSAQIGKGTDNVGVIAVRVFREKPKPVTVLRRPSQPFMPRPVWPKRPYWGSGDDPCVSGSLSSSSVSRQSSGTSNLGTYSANTGPPLTHDYETMEETKLGTQFGEAMAWATRSVVFERETHPDTSLIIYYDTRKNLERRGIQFENQRPTMPLPDPFPGNEKGCAIPEGWHR